MAGEEAPQAVFPALVGRPRHQVRTSLVTTPSYQGPHFLLHYDEVCVHTAANEKLGEGLGTLLSESW